MVTGLIQIRQRVLLALSVLELAFRLALKYLAITGDVHADV
jgi:hypothetical protein